MTLTRLHDTGIRRLDQIFSPPGMPLVRKVPDVSPTTSIAVRGGAGVGKTTLALALALTLAREAEGVVLHLTTELDPVEVRLKAERLGLPDGSVQRWGSPNAPRATVLATHLGLYPSDSGPQTPSERKFGALQLVWDLLHPEEAPQIPAPAAPPSKPVRVVVIDAFAAPQPEESQDALRRDLVALVQGLEGEGVSTVLIEETLGDAPSWLPFVVDIVFELAWAADGDTGELGRKLRCTKSRHAMARPGPHDYGAEGNALCVWPDVLMAVAPEAKLHLSEPLRLAHMLDTTRCAVFTDGGVLPAPTDGDGWRVDTVVTHTPGAHAIEVRCGALTTIEDVKRGVRLQWTDSMGVSALGWMLVGLLREGPNVVVLREPQLLLRRAHQAPGVMRLIDALRGLGAIVVLSGKAHDLMAFSGMSDLPDAATSRPHVRALLDLPYRTAAWRVGLMAMIRALQTDLTEKSALPVMGTKAIGQFQALHELANVAQRIDTAGGLDLAGAIIQQLNILGPGTRIAGADNLFTLLAWAAGRRQLPSRANTPTASWICLLLGSEARAFDQLYATKIGTVPRLHKHMWAVLAATQAGNPLALRMLNDAPDLEQEIALDFRLRATLQWQGKAQFDALLTTAASRLHVERAALEAQLIVAETVQNGRPVFEAMSALTERGAWDPLIKADMSFNLALAAEHLGQRKDAMRQYAAALRLSPHLEEASSRLTRLSVDPLEASTR